jgi:hypothetical protein
MAIFNGKSPPKDLKIGGVQFGLSPVLGFVIEPLSSTLDVLECNANE